MESIYQIYNRATAFFCWLFQKSDLFKRSDFFTPTTKNTRNESENTKNRFRFFLWVTDLTNGRNLSNHDIFISDVARFDKFPSCLSIL